MRKWILAVAVLGMLSLGSNCSGNGNGGSFSRGGSGSAPCTPGMTCGIPGIPGDQAGPSVPEPSSALLAAAGALVLGTATRRRRDA